MPDLVSPGVSVTVTDESFYAGASQGTVPLFVVASAQDKADPSTTGATAIGARDFLIAYNINLNSTSSRRANAVAFDIREAGRIKREGGVISGKVIKDENGELVREPGSLKSVKGIGWYIEEYESIVQGEPPNPINGTSSSSSCNYIPELMQ